MDNNFKLERDDPNYDYEFASNNEWLCLMRKLYLECFSKELPSESVMPSKEELNEEQKK